MTRTVKDAVYILQAIVGRDSWDNYTDAIPHNIIPGYVSACSISALSGVRLGILATSYHYFQITRLSQ